MRSIPGFILFTATAAAFVSPAARAEEPRQVIPGQRLRGEIELTEQHTLALYGVRGMTLTLRLRALGGRPTLRPVLTLLEPDGDPVDLAPFSSSSARGDRLTVARLPLEETGAYRLIVHGDEATTGAYLLITRGKAPSKVKGSGSVDAPGGVLAVPVEAHAGDSVKIAVKPAHGSDAQPLVDAFVEPSGAQNVLGGVSRSAAVVADEDGEHHFDVSFAAGTTGNVTYVVTLKRPRASTRVAPVGDYAIFAPGSADEPSLYADPGTVPVDVFVTIAPLDNPEKDEDEDCPFSDPEDGVGTTLHDVHQDLDPYDDCKPELNVRVSMDGLPDPGNEPNAEMRLRGKTSRFADQKSYRIKLKSKAAADLWRGQRTLNLNKHPFDLTRFRNKLAFDLFAGIPDLTSMRTQFLNLYVDRKDGQGPVDFGLYTHVEKLDKRALIARGQDPESHVYKAEDFEFLRYPEALKLESDPDFDEDVFARRLDPEEGHDHGPLLDMLDALNDESNDFAEVFATHFDEANYLTWLASSVLFDNIDTNAQNFLLVRAARSKVFYFAPWDYDGSFDFYGQPGETYVPARWQRGVSNWWAVTLHRRYLKQPGAIARLQAKMEEIKDTHATAARIAVLADSYRGVVRAAIERSPDFEFLPPVGPDPLAAFDAEVARLPALIESRFQQFLDTLERPMPVFQWVETGGGMVRFAWEESYDLQGDGLTYDFELSTSPRFEPQNLVAQSLGRPDATPYEVPRASLPAGTYYFRVIIRDDKSPSTNWQVAFDKTFDPDTGELFEGVVAIDL